MEKLREEIVEAQKIRADLIKWKLVLVAALGATGLGLWENPANDMTLLLCLIPFVCVYVDLAARHLNLRMHVIAEFMRRQKNSISSNLQWMPDYEEYVKAMAVKGIFGLETGILRTSTIFLSIIVVVAGFILPSCAQSNLKLSLFCLSGILGIVAAIYIDINYRKKIKDISAP